MHICSDEVLLRSLVDLELIGLLKADRFTEKMLHEVFSDLRIKTCAEEGSTEECEWFMETSGLLNYIRELPTLIRPTWEQVFPNGYPGKHHWTHASKPSGRNVQGRGIRIKYPRSAWKPART
jgi:predicted secreted protein